MNIKYFLYGDGIVLENENMQIQHFSNIEDALLAISSELADYVILCDARLSSKLSELLPEYLADYDLIHGGLHTCSENQFDSLWFVSANWFYINPRSDRRGVSWKATPSLCCLRPETLRKLGGFDAAYQGATSRLMDFAYRLLMAGGRVCHCPEWETIIQDLDFKENISLVDQCIFISRSVSETAAWYSMLWKGLISKNVFKVFSTVKTSKERLRMVPPPTPKSSILDTSQLIGKNRRQHINSISAIIPTINRYEYLPKAIESLLKQKPIPDEIIVVDQTPRSKRQPRIYEPYANKVRVIYLDQAGQSTARNVAIEVAKSDWCLLFEDDAVAWDNMLSEHIYLAEHSGADGVSGLFLAPWKTVENIPTKLRHTRLSDVFATGNCLIKRETLLSVGCLDPAFDRGSGADHDLGARLYLNGNEIIFTPKAIATHYKSPTGGMRMHGAWWKTYSETWSVYPQPTQIFTIHRYYPTKYHLMMYILYYLKAKKQMKWYEFIWLWISLPWKLSGAIKLAAKLGNPSIPKYGREQTV